MSHYIVLVKQVPDVSQITDNAFDPETGTLIRSRLTSVINDLDAQALAFANQMRRDSGDEEGQVICLSMGPPMAEEVLRYSLSRCADRAVLLTDRALGGADTRATANPLAYAIRKIVRQMLEATKDYYIISGMQSVDGDTAQVPAQIAEELGLACIAYATRAVYKQGRFEFTRIISGGSEVVTARRLPVVVTVAKHEYPLFATFTGTRRAKRMEVIRWAGDDIAAPHIGVKGSKTRVIRVFPPGKSRRKAQQVSDAGALARVLIEDIQADADAGESGGQTESLQYILPDKRPDKFDRRFEATKKEQEDFALLREILNSQGIDDISEIDEQAKQRILAEAGKHFHKKALEDMLAGLQLTEPSYSGQVWVVAEHTDSQVHPATFELVGKARQLADSLDTQAGVVVAGANPKSLADGLIAAGADCVYVISHELLGRFDATAHRKAVADAIEYYRPQIVLFVATPRGRMLAPLVSYRLQCGLTADCTSLDIRDSSRKGQVGVLLQTRPALGGNVMATICTKNSRSQMATARPGVMKSLDPDASRKGRVIEHRVQLDESDMGLEILRAEMSKGQADMSAEVIVSGGKGMQSRDNYERLVGSLCNVVAKRLGAQVERGASRAAVEQGFVDRVHQVGQTGTAVGPKLYIALGISGAIQHMIGIANSQRIVAINSDPNAPIFKQCDYYLIGTVEETVPQLAEALERL